MSAFHRKKGQPMTHELPVVSAERAKFLADAMGFTEAEWFEVREILFAYPKALAEIERLEKRECSPQVITTLASIAHNAKGAYDNIYKEMEKLHSENVRLNQRIAELDNDLDHARRMALDCMDKRTNEALEKAGLK
jgi:5'-3' exonuclease